MTRSVAGVAPDHAAQVEVALEARGAGAPRCAGARRGRAWPGPARSGCARWRSGGGRPRAWPGSRRRPSLAPARRRRRAGSRRSAGSPAARGGARGWRGTGRVPSSPEVVSAEKFMSWITRSTLVALQQGQAGSSGEAARSASMSCSENSTSRAMATAAVVVDNEYGRHAAKNNIAGPACAVRCISPAGCNAQALRVAVRRRGGGGAPGRAVHGAQAEQPRTRRRRPIR